MLPPSKKMIQSGMLESEFLNMRIPLHVKYPCHVRPIPVGKSWVLESIQETTKASVKNKYVTKSRDNCA